MVALPPHYSFRTTVRFSTVLSIWEKVHHRQYTVIHRCTGSQLPHVFINRTLMQKLIYNELNKVEDTRIKHVSEYKFLDRYGEIGEYMRLELKLLLRNKICKRSLYSITGVVIMFSSIISFSDVYDGV